VGLCRASPLRDRDLVHCYDPAEGRYASLWIVTSVRCDVCVCLICKQLWYVGCVQ
jgi:hypothetical protein